jgi:hypothetical protein
MPHTGAFTHSLTHARTHSLTHPLTQTRSHSLTHARTHSLIHSPQGLNELMRNLLRKIVMMPHTAAFFEAFTAPTPDGQPRGQLLIDNKVRG